MSCETGHIEGLTHLDFVHRLREALHEAAANVGNIPDIIKRLAAIGCPLARAFLLFAPFIPQLAPELPLIESLVNQLCPPVPVPTPTPA